MEIVKNSNGTQAPAGAVRFHMRALSDGTMLIRYFQGDSYLGEMNIWAATREALQIMVADLHQRTPRVVTPG